MRAQLIPTTCFVRAQPLLKCIKSVDFDPAAQTERVNYFNMTINPTFVRIGLLLEIVVCSGGSSFFDNCFYSDWECPSAHISFWLYKNHTQHQPQKIRLQELDASIFEPRLPVTILIHGFTGHRNFSPNPEVRPVLLSTQAVHVITVDYGPLARFPCYYPWAVFNAHHVGKCLALLIDGLIARNISGREDIHLIGFSLGSQIAGLTANHVKNKLSRITALDPARPAYITDNLNEKLDPTDADFVDVIHTDPYFYALITPCGHADFYPNLEHFFQPGCSFWQDGQLRNCNHFRAPLYYAESVTSKIGFWSFNCGGYVDFMLGRCMDYAHLPHDRMGYFVDKK